MGRRPTVASGMARSFTGSSRPEKARANGSALVNRSQMRKRPGGPGGSVSSGADVGSEGPWVDGQLESLSPVHQHDGDADTAFELERIVAVDVDLLELEGRAGPFGEGHLPC